LQGAVQRLFWGFATDFSGNMGRHKGVASTGDAGHQHFGWGLGDDAALAANRCPIASVRHQNTMRTTPQQGMRCLFRVAKSGLAQQTCFLQIDI